MQFEYRYNQTAIHMLAASYSGHAFPAAIGWQFDYPIKNIIPLKMVASSICLPKDDPKNPRGDDAHFIASDHQFIGVADGVGGWRLSGIDGGEYARQIMSNSVVSLRGSHVKSPKRVLEEAYSKTTVQGSSTACIISFSGNKKILRAANVGDSGFLVVRNNEVVYRSPTQQRSFNCPYQLGTTKDDPSVALEIEFRVKKGDLVILGTDGLFDNMLESEILETLDRGFIMLGNDLAEMCSYLANMALYNSFDRFRVTPFSIASSRRAGKKHRGGKIDDITVIIARIE
ncbi:hypothetical protein CASFOL_019480 [Castilleja foliolosa]|uniref:Protein phosphatase n=1 Tax=Castilleja foliolosa TaxID=1961234 RepID=A0ABD3D864_9LAMI